MAAQAGEAESLTSRSGAGTILCMIAIEAHFDGGVIIPDEPLDLSPNSKVMVLVDVDDPAGQRKLNDAVRDYYLAQPPEDRDLDERWGKDLAADSSEAWGGD